ncbi:MAG: hypothetical protein ACFFC9_12620, partial [Promethearchaeota archaeon]
SFDFGALMSELMISTPIYYFFLGMTNSCKVCLTSMIIYKRSYLNVLFLYIYKKSFFYITEFEDFRSYLIRNLLAFKRVIFINFLNTCLQA